MRQMRKFVTILAATSLVAGVAVAGGATPASHGKAEGAWTTVAASGKVEAATVSVEESWREVRRGDVLPSSTAVRTGKRGRATLTRTASVLIVDPATEIVLPEPGDSRMETSVVQTQGSVVYDVDSRKSPHFEVVTPHLVAGVKGTRFVVTVKDGFTSVSVKHGLVEALDIETGERAEIGAGESVFLDGHDRGFDFHDMEQANEPRVRAEIKRLARAERDRPELRDRERLDRDGDDLRDRMALKGEHRGEQDDWVADAGDGGVGDYDDDFGEDDTEYEEKAFGDDPGNGHGNAYGHDKGRGNPFGDDDDDDFDDDDDDLDDDDDDFDDDDPGSKGQGKGNVNRP